MSTCFSPSPSMRAPAALLFAALLSGCQAADAQRFDRQVLDDAMEGGYGVTVADIDSDGLNDVVAWATNPAQLVWYRNPGWEKVVITPGTTGNIAVAPHDIDGDGDVDLVLASAFNLRTSREGGLVQWLENPGDPLVNQSWAIHAIDAVPTSHRLRWADIQGDGRLELFNLPIVGIGATEPDYAVGAALTAYAIPDDPQGGPWPKVVIADDLEMAHGLIITDWDDDGREDLMTASFAGVELFQLAHQGEFVNRRVLGEGHRNPRPQQGSSEVGIGKLTDGERFVASIEPWHGDEVVVYRPSADGSMPWQREVIDAEFNGGHALAVADLNNDGVDEIIAGFRSNPYGLYIYRFDGATGLWQRSRVDSGRVAVSGLVVSDINDDGYNDIVAVGAATANVVLFVNEGG